MLLIFLSYLIKFGTESLINLIIRSQLEFVEGSYHFRMWRANEYPYEVEFYFFNWTNSDRVRDPNIKPRFEEIGPYRFELYINRTDIRIHHENSSVTYAFTKRFVHIPNMADRSLDDVIITLNPIANVS